MTEISASNTFTTISPPRLVKGNVRDTAQRVGMIKTIPPTGDLGIGLSDRIYLIGHSDNIVLNSPHQVVNLQDTVNILGANADSSLLRGLFDVYNEGARDIWIVASAPMFEYVEDVSKRNIEYEVLGDQTFHEAYFDRLTTTYAMLEEFSEVEIIVPLEAPFYYTADVDFLTQLSDHCEQGLATTGRVRMGVIGTRIGTHTSNEVNVMANDSRLATVSASVGGKFVVIVGGEVSISHSQIQLAYSSSAATLAAGAIATSRVERGLIHKKFRGAMHPSFREYTDAEVSTLALAKVNWVGRTKLGRRSVPYQVHAKTDNTLSPTNSSLRAVANVRVMSKVINSLYAMGSRFIGTIGYPQFKQDVASYLNYLMFDDVIKNYDLTIYRDDADPFKIIVDVNLQMFGTMREIFLSVAVGNKSMVS